MTQSGQKPTPKVEDHAQLKPRAVIDAIGSGRDPVRSALRTVARRENRSGSPRSYRIAGASRTRNPHRTPIVAGSRQEAADRSGRSKRKTIMSWTRCVPSISTRSPHAAAGPMLPSIRTGTTNRRAGTCAPMCGVLRPSRRRGKRRSGSGRITRPAPPARSSTSGCRTIRDRRWAMRARPSVRSWVPTPRKPAPKAALRRGDNPRDHTEARRRWEEAPYIEDQPTYAEDRGISISTLHRFRDDVRCGAFGGIYFAHRILETGDIVGFEQRWEKDGRKNIARFAKGGVKTVSVFGNPKTATRMVVFEGGLDALALAEIEAREGHDLRQHRRRGSGRGRRQSSSSLPRADRFCQASTMMRRGRPCTGNSPGFCSR